MPHLKASLKVSDSSSQLIDEKAFAQDKHIRDAMKRFKSRSSKSNRSSTIFNENQLARRTRCSYLSTDCFVDKDSTHDPPSGVCPTKESDAAVERIPSQARESDVDWWRSKIRRQSGTTATITSVTIASGTITSSDDSEKLNEETVSVQTTLSALTMGSRKMITNKNVVETKLSNLIPDVICFKITKRRGLFGFLRGRRSRRPKVVKASTSLSGAVGQ
mmetsp:Transcript_11107/g.13159  ORF Transcript_11107/g.13159 Transcript_11107/m.13159 type:complete len:218 (+) Transcript_11107:114-767(+)